MEMIKLEYFQLVKNFNFLKGNGKLSLIWFILDQVHQLLDMDNIYMYLEDIVEKGKEQE